MAHERKQKPFKSFYNKQYNMICFIYIVYLYIICFYVYILPARNLLLYFIPSTTIYYHKYRIYIQNKNRTLRWFLVCWYSMRYLVLTTFIGSSILESKLFICTSVQWYFSLSYVSIQTHILSSIDNLQLFLKYYYFQFRQCR